MVMLRPLHRPR